LEVETAKPPEDQSFTKENGVTRNNFRLSCDHGNKVKLQWA
jgi:hypothetical protein